MQLLLMYQEMEFKEIVVSLNAFSKLHHDSVSKPRRHLNIFRVHLLSYAAALLEEGNGYLKKL